MISGVFVVFSAGFGRFIVFDERSPPLDLILSRTFRFLTSIEFCGDTGVSAEEFEGCTFLGKLLLWSSLYPVFDFATAIDIGLRFSQSLISICRNEFIEISSVLQKASNPVFDGSPGREENFE